MDAKEVVSKYMIDVNNWLKENKLSTLPPYDKLKDKSVLGPLYRNDQLYYEAVATHRANLFSLKSFYLKERSSESVRTQGRFDSIIDLITNEIYMINNYTDAAKQRVKFYESIMYMISNMTYGDF